MQWASLSWYEHLWSIQIMRSSGHGINIPAVFPFRVVGPLRPTFPVHNQLLKHCQGWKNPADYKKIHRLLHKAKALPPHKRCCFLPHEYLASVNMRATSCIWTWGFQTCLQNPRSTSHVLPGRKATILLLSQLPATPFSTSRQSKSRRREVLVHWSEVYQDNKRFANLVVFIARRRPCQTEKTQHLGFKEFPQDSNQLCSPLWLLIHVLQKSTGWGNLLQSH